MNATKPRKAPATALYSHVLPSPVGDLFLVVDEAGAVVQLRFLNQNRTLEGMTDDAETQLKATLVPDARRFRHVIEQLDAYFRGERRDFDLELAARGTDFQQAVWNQLRRIPYGTTASYQDIAAGVAGALGRPTSARAVGGANGANPISIIVPCHRVIGADGSLTGFGGGLDVKQHLLVLEGALLL